MTLTSRFGGCFECGGVVMWASFFVCAALLTLTLFVPCYLALRALGLERSMSLCLSPVTCVTLFCTAGIIFHELGIGSSALLYGILLWALCFAMLAFAALGKAAPFCDRPWPRGGLSGFSGAKVLCLYLALGVFASIVMFLLPLDGPDSTVQTYDNVHQFGLIRSFVDSGSWCTVHTSSYLNPASAEIDPIPGEGYYPPPFTC